jgi:putative ABC transport system permease protein
MVLAAVAGARRTDTAMPRFLAYHRTGANAVVYSPSGRQSRELGVLTALPEVARATRLAATVLASPDPANPARLRTSFGLLSLDPGGSWIFGRPMVVSGRLPDERRADEVVVDEELAARAHLWVGSIWRVGVYTTAQFEQHGPDTPTRPKGPTVDLRIVGVVRQPADLLPIVTEQDNLHVNRSDLYLTPAYWQRYGPDLTGYGVIVLVALDRGQTDLPRLAADVRRRLGPEVVVGSVDPNGGGYIGIPGAAIPGLRRAIGLEASALLAFAALAAIAVLLLVGQTLGRQIFLESVEYPTLRALGMTRGQLVSVALIRSALIGAGGLPSRSLPQLPFRRSPRSDWLAALSFTQGSQLI